MAWASLPAVCFALWAFMALPPSELVTLQCRIVRKIYILSVSVMVPFLQQGMLCPCKSGVLLVCAICWGVAISLCTLGAPSLATRLITH